jgi:hypothetical protein
VTKWCQPITTLLIQKLNAAGIKVMVAISTAAKDFILKALLHPQINSVLYSHAENSIEQYKCGLLLLAFGTHVSYLWYPASELRYRIAKLAAMVLIVTTLSCITGVAAEITALLNGILKVKYMAGGINFNYHAWYWTVLFERMLVTVDGDVQAATQLVKKRESEDCRKGGNSVMNISFNSVL